MGDCGRLSQSEPPEFYNQQVAHLPVNSLGAFVRPLNGSMMFRVSAGARLQTGGGKWQSCAPLLARSQWGAYS
jgi:hypothetical protein